jgi:hypothetical protein
MPDLPLWAWILFGVFTIAQGLYASATTGDALWGTMFGILGVVLIYVSVLSEAETRTIHTNRERS